MNAKQSKAFSQLPTWAIAEAVRADELTTQAYAAHLAGDLVRAGQLRDEMDAIWAALEAKAEALTTGQAVPAGVVKDAHIQPGAG